MYLNMLQKMIAEQSEANQSKIKEVLSKICGTDKEDDWKLGFEETIDAIGDYIIQDNEKELLESEFSNKPLDDPGTRRYKNFKVYMYLSNQLIKAKKLPSLDMNKHITQGVLMNPAIPNMGIPRPTMEADIIIKTFYVYLVDDKEDMEQEQKNVILLVQLLSMLYNDEINI